MATLLTQEALHTYYTIILLDCSRTHKTNLLLLGNVRIIRRCRPRWLVSTDERLVLVGTVCDTPLPVLEAQGAGGWPGNAGQSKILI